MVPLNSRVYLKLLIERESKKERKKGEIDERKQLVGQNWEEKKEKYQIIKRKKSIRGKNQSEKKVLYTDRSSDDILLSR